MTAKYLFSEISIIIKQLQYNNYRLFNYFVDLIKISLVKYLMKNEKNKTAIFLILTFGISYLIAGLFYLSDMPYNSIYGIIFAVVYMFVPAFATLLVEKLIYKTEIIDSLFIRFKFNKWFIISWLIPPVLAFLTFAISLLLPNIGYSADMEGMFTRFSSMMTPEQLAQMKSSVEDLPVHPVWITLVQGLLAGLTINAIAGFGEELGWRGFLVKQFEGMKFIPASLWIGFIWGIWHAPVILMGHNYPEHPIPGIFMMILWCILLSPVFLYMLIKSKSVIAASIMHGTLNGTAGIAILMVVGGNDLTAGVTGLAGFLALLIIIALIFIYDFFIVREKIILKMLTLKTENEEIWPKTLDKE